MDYFLDNWGNFIGIAGLIITGIGVIISYLAFHRAGKARDAAAAAEIASKETRAALTRTLTTVDLERTIALAQRLKELHRANRWDTALECYHLLQVMLADIATWHPAPTDEMRGAVSESIQLIQEMERQVDTARGKGTTPPEFNEFNFQLNEIQGLLREVALSIHSGAGGESN